MVGCVLHIQLKLTVQTFFQLKIIDVIIIIETLIMKDTAVVTILLESI